MSKSKRKSAPSQALMLADIPERNRLRELQSLLDTRRDQIAELDLEIETVRDQLIGFENTYQARVAEENFELVRIEQLVRHCERWADLLHEAPAATLAEQAERLGARRARELAQSATRPALTGGAADDSAETQGDVVSAPRSPNERLKAAYRALARRFHPDLATNEADRVQFSETMARINALYHDGDLDRLEAMAEQAKGGSLDEPELDISAQLGTLEKRQ